MIEIRNLYKMYVVGSTKIYALNNVSFTINRGEFITIMGPSGSGKSTLLHVLGILDLPTSGEYILDSHAVTTLRDRELARIRNRHFGFVFQDYNLFPELSAFENVTLPLIYAHRDKSTRHKRAKELLEKLGMKDRMHHYPNMLSGGEQQRVAIARALANNPTFILADEPTGNLPSAMGEEIMATLKELNGEGVTIIMVTHDDHLGRSGQRLIRIRDGKLESDGPAGKAG